MKQREYEYICYKCSEPIMELVGHVSKFVTVKCCRCKEMIYTNRVYVGAI